MFKKFLNFIKFNKEERKLEKEVETEKNKDNIKTTNEHENNVEIKVNEKNDINTIETKIDKNTDYKKEYDFKISEEDMNYIKLIKIEREKRIKAIDLYTNEEIIFENFKDCSKKLGVPIAYIKENLMYGYTDFFGEAIKFLSKQLKIDINHKELINKNIIDKFNFLHNKLWTDNINDLKREEILSSDKIEPISMHYKFETLDSEYDEYYKKYGKIIRRGGKKKIELIDKKNEVIEVFKSLDECANFFSKNKREIINRLKCGECKIGRYEIRYSLRR